MRSIQLKTRWLAALVVAVISCTGDSTEPDSGAVASVVIAPPKATVAVGSTAPLTAEVLDASGKALEGRKIAWVSANPAVATVSSTGVVTGVAIGVVHIAASAEGKSAIAEVTVNPTPVASVRLSPTSRDLLVGQTVQLSAQPLDAQGNSLDGRPVTFTTSNPSIATVNASGLVTALAAGSTIITATAEGKNSVATINVATVPVVSVAVSPGSNSLVVGQTTQLSAEPRDASGKALVGRLVAWSTSAAAVASVSSSGLVTAIGAGTATITATSEGKAGTATITVSPKPVSSVIVSPGQANVTVGQTMQLTGQVTDDQGNVLPGRPISFSSGSAGVATVSASGLVTGIAPGTATITATSEGKTGTATVTVTPIPVATVTVSPNAPSVVVGQNVQLSAAAKAANGQDLTGRTVGWSSGAPSVATVAADGTVTGLAPGTAIIFAGIEGVVGTATVTVRQVAVGSVVVTPSTASVAVGGSTQLSASVRDGSGAELQGRLVGWTSSDESIAVVSSAGRVSGLKAGTVTITASSEGKSGTAAVTVTVAPVASVTVTPPTASVVTGQTTTLQAQTLDANGAVLTGRAVSWSSSNNSVATVSQTGVVTGVAPGNATITATSEGKSATAAITVTSVPVASVTVAPGSLPLQTGQTGNLTATVRDAANNVLTDRAIAWTSSNNNVATVAPNGTVTAVAVGTATITATSEGKTGTATVTVTAPPPAAVATVAVAPSTLPLQVGQTGGLTATTRDAANNVLTGRTVTWSSSNTNIATVAPNGTVTAVAVGTATITATSEGKTGTATVTVTAPPPAAVATVTVAPSTLPLQVGQTGTLTATTRDAGNTVLTGRTVTWSSGATSVATVAVDGTVTAVGVGAATVTATSEGKTGTATVNVSAPPPAAVASVSVSPTTASLTTGATQQITATPRDAQNNALAGRAVTWASGNTGVATVTQAGLITAVGPGTTSVTATSEGKVGTVAVTVTAPATGSVGVTPTSAGVFVGATTTLAATVRDVSGATMAGAPVAWSSDKPLTASVSQSGVVTGLIPGSATVTASSGGKSGAATITVSLAPVASVTVSPSQLNLRDRDGQRTGTLTATLQDAGGNTLTGRVVAWSSSNTQVATVTQAGLVTAQKEGDTTITAASEGKSGTASVSVKK